MDDTEKQINRVGAEHEIKFLEFVREQSLGHSVSLSKWLQASLLAINGAGAVGVLNALEKISHPVLAASCFTIGLMLALLSGVLNQRSGYIELKPINERIGYWLTVVDDGERSEEIEKRFEEESKAIRRRGLRGPLAGWASAICFGAGAWILALSGWQTNAANDYRCLQIQRDMLRAGPRRTEDATMFQALGCKPQGHESAQFAPEPTPKSNQLQGPQRR